MFFAETQNKLIYAVTDNAFLPPKVDKENNQIVMTIP